MRVVVPVLLALLYGLALLFNSQHQGKLSLPATYDDVFYFADALKRLQSVYDAGPRQFFVDYVREPPHSPITTVTCMVAFGLLGPHDWAPAAVRIGLVAGVLVLLSAPLIDRSLVEYVAAAVALLGWPLMGHLVIESRPDIVCGGLTALGLLTMLGGRWISVPAPRSLGVSAAFGLALLAKPSISPLTVCLYVLGLAAATLVDRHVLTPTPSLREALRTNVKSVGIVAVIALPHYLLNWRAVYGYVLDTEFGRNRDLWALKLTASEHLLYYLTGPGGQTMMGPWLPLTAASLLVSLGFAVAHRGSVHPLRLVSALAASAFALLAVSIPAHKSPLLGAVVAGLCAVAFVKSTVFTLDRLGRGRRRGWAAAYAGVLCAAALSLFQWPWGAEPERAIISSRRWDLQADLAREIATRAEGGGRVFFVALARYLGPEGLTVELVRRRVRGVTAFDAHRSDEIETYKAAIEAADFIVTFTDDHDEVETWLPSARVLPIANALIAQDPRFERVSTFPSPSGRGAVELFMKRRPFADIHREIGLDRLEGPYPESNLPRVRWGLGPSMSFVLRERATGMLRFTARSFVPDQLMDVAVDGRPIGRCSFPRQGIPEVCDLPLDGAGPGTEVTLRFRVWEGTRRHALLFQDIAVVRAPRPLRGVPP